MSERINSILSLFTPLFMPDVKVEEVEQYFLNSHTEYYPPNYTPTHTHYSYDLVDHFEQIHSLLDAFRNTSMWEVLRDVNDPPLHIFLALNRQLLTFFEVQLYEDEFFDLFFYKTEADFNSSLKAVYESIEKDYCRGGYGLFWENRTIFPSKHPKHENTWISFYPTHVAFYNKFIPEEPCLILYETKIQFDRVFKRGGWNRNQAIVPDFVLRMIFYLNEEVIVYVPDRFPADRLIQGKWLKGELQNFNHESHEVKVNNQWFHYSRLYKPSLIAYTKASELYNPAFYETIAKSHAFLIEWEQEPTVVLLREETSYELKTQFLLSCIEGVRY